MKRGPGSDNPGEWCFPGGRLEEDEDAATAAIRETEEETGGFKATKSALALWTRRIAPRETTGVAPTPPPDQPVEPLETLRALAQPTTQGTLLLPGEEVDFTTFVLHGQDEFIPDVEKSGEHTAYAWAKPVDAPVPLHPGARVALDRFTMDELGVANAMMMGELASPQRYGSFSMFVIRITGTGVAYRHRKMDGKKVVRDEEFVYRNPKDYIKSEFLERCAGLLVVMEHPDVLSMNHEEFEKRTIGMVFKAYFADATGKAAPADVATDVWAVAKIYNEDAIEVMTEKQLSTSPGVVWRSADANVMTKIDGHNFLLEDNPSLMDHIAVCYQGVWDKEGPPLGVQTVEARKDSAMEIADLEKMVKENQNKTDTALGTVLAGFESLTGAVGKIVSRFDSEDKARDDARKDSARKRMDSMKFKGHHEDDDGTMDAASRVDGRRTRHDATEAAMCDAMEEAGEDKESAKKKANDARKDAARKRADSFKFSGRKDEEDEESTKKRHDAEEGELRYDMEEAGEDKEKAAAAAKDRRKRHDEEESKRHDSTSGLRAENVDLRKRLDSMEKVMKDRLPAVTPQDEDPKAFSAAQSAFDSVFPLLGLKTPAPMQYEPLLSYRKRGIIELKKFSETYKDSDINVAAVDSSIFDPMFKTIIGEASAMARTDAAVPEGQLLEHVEMLPSGAPSKVFRGRAGSWMSQFMPSGRIAEIKRHNALGKAH